MKSSRLLLPINPVLHCAMPWTSTLTAPLKLRNGRELKTLFDVRELLLDVPRPLRFKSNWKRPAELLMKSAAEPTFQADLQMQLENYLLRMELI
jgi:hypothetical protein